MIVKHANPCGVAVAGDVVTAYQRAHACDPVSAFGGIVAVNRPMPAAAAAALAPVFTEVVVAPSYDDDALATLVAKPNLRVLVAAPPGAPRFDVRPIDGGLLVQTPDPVATDPEAWWVVTSSEPTPAQWDDLQFAWTVCAAVSSNAIVYARDRQAVGIGAGSRTASTRRASPATVPATGRPAGCAPATPSSRSVTASTPPRQRVSLPSSSPAAASATPRSSPLPTSTAWRWCSRANATSAIEPAADDHGGGRAHRYPLWRMTRVADLLAAGPTYSFEFFPPKSDAAQLSLGRTIAELEPLAPSFVSVTYGAGGSTRERTREVVKWVAKETAITPMAHLTCQGQACDEIVAILDDYRSAGIENILALGGDVPVDSEPAPSDYRFASELLDDIDHARFSVGVAAHPEVHPRSPDRETDRRYLAAKLRRADFAITQFFFEAEHYLRLVDELGALGVDKPVLPGIMPITNAGQVRRMAELSGSALPAWLVGRLDGVDDPVEVRRIGVDVASALCAELLAAGAPGLHLYTLNRSTASREIYANLGLAGVPE